MSVGQVARRWCPVFAAGIPQDLIDWPQWVIWRAVWRDGKWTKPPLDPLTLGLARVDDPSTWATIHEALTTCARVGADGIGFVLTTGVPFSLVDLDCCWDPVARSWDATALEIVSALDSYTELSPSGTGVHVIVRATLPPQGRKHGRVEMYDAGRFFAVTGRHMPRTPATVCERQAEIEELHRRLFGDASPASDIRACTLPASADRILEKAFARGTNVRRLWDGDWSGFPSQSEADLSLCRHLFLSGGDANAVDRLFRQSGLFRAKWDQRRGALTYGEMTVLRAVHRG